MADKKLTQQEEIYAEYGADDRLTVGIMWGELSGYRADKAAKKRNRIAAIVVGICWVALCIALYLFRSNVDIRNILFIVELSLTVVLLVLIVSFLESKYIGWLALACLVIMLFATKSLPEKKLTRLVTVFLDTQLEVKQSEKTKIDSLRTAIIDSLEHSKSLKKRNSK